MVRVWLTSLIRRVLIGILLVGLTFGVGMIWRCYALEGSPNPQSEDTTIGYIGGDYGLTVKQNGATIKFEIDRFYPPATDLIHITYAPHNVQVVTDQRYVDCYVWNTDNGHEEQIGGSLSWPVGLWGTDPADLEAWNARIATERFQWTVTAKKFYHDDIKRASQTRTNTTYSVSIQCHYRIWIVTKRPHETLAGQFWYDTINSEETWEKNHFLITTSSPANEDPPFRTTTASWQMQMPGRQVRYEIPPFDQDEYYDEYSVVANPSAISSIHVNSTKGIFGVDSKPNGSFPLEPHCWFPGNPLFGPSTPDFTSDPSNDLNHQQPITITGPGERPERRTQYFRLKTCNLTPTIRNAADIRDGIIYNANIYLINVSHNRIAGQMTIPIHANDLTLVKSWSDLKPNVEDHGHGTTGMGTAENPIFQFKDGEAFIVKAQHRNIYWRLNEGDSTAHADFNESNCSPDPVHVYPEENDIFQLFDYYPTIWFCSPGTTTVGAYISDIPNRYHLIRRWTVNVSETEEENTQEEDADIGETDVRGWEGGIMPPTPTPPPQITRSILVDATPTPAPTKGPFLYVPALTPTPVPPPDVLPGHEDYTRQQEFTNETPIVESVGAVSRNDNNTYKVNVRFSTVTGADRYEIRITQPDEQGERNIIQHLPVNNPDGNQFTFDTLYHKGRLKIEVRGVAECPEDNIGACVVQTLNDPEYRINPGTSEYTPWSLPYGTAMEFLLTPPLVNPDSVNTIGDDTGRYVNSKGESLTGEVGGLAVQLLGLNTDATRNMGITIWAMICLGLATGVYIAAWKGSGSKSALSPVGGFLAVLTLIITWSVLGYIFWELKAGTAALPLAALLFVGIFKVWNTVKG